MADHRGDDADIEDDFDARGKLLSEESQAFLAGRYLECAAGGPASAPGWAWLNRIAHGSRHDLARAASMGCASSDCSGMTAFMAYLAAEVLATADRLDVPLETVQRTTLIPLELALSHQHSRPFGDAVRLAADILAILENHRHGQTR
jgi:hypothetical protein